MIRTSETEHVRVKLPSVQRSAEEVGRLLIDAMDRHWALKREREAAMAGFHERERAIGAEVADLIREGKGQAAERWEDVACEVWYDCDQSEGRWERVLRRPDPHPCDALLSDEYREVLEHIRLVEVSRRPMTPQEREQAARLAEEQRPR